MSEQKKKETPETTKVESPKIPNVAYPLKPRGNVTNLSQQYFNHLAGDESARFLFNNSGLWHQGIHLRASKFPSSEFENDKICAIADGKLIAYKVDSEYKKDNSKAEAPMEGAVYSTGYFLVKHEVAYPKDNVLTFYSLYRHTAKLSDYKSGIEKVVGVTKSADNKIVIRDAQNHPLNPRVELNNGVTIGVRRQTQTQDKFDELLWYRETKDNKTIEHKPKTGERWRIFHQSYEVMQSEQIKGLPLLSKHKIDTQADVEVKLDKPIEIKAGEALGLMGEYNQAGESGEKLLHLEVFTYDNIEQFKAKAEAAYKQDKEKKGIKDNFLYVARGSQLYTVLKDEVVELEKTQVEIMVPLADVAKKTVKKKTDKTGKDYYNVQPYLYSLVQKNKDGGIYVDDSHLTHGLLFPGVNVFNQTENGLCIFKHGLHQHIDPKSDLAIEQKNELDPMFKSIMDELDLDKDKNAAVSFEAGKLKDLLLSPVQQRRLTGIVAKHDSEWKKTRAADFIRTRGTYRDNNKEDSASRIEKRVEDLSIKLEVDGFNSDKQAYYLHPLGLIGWLSGMCMPLKEAKETALIISGTYEGKGGFASLSGNFDNMGMSWGIVQFNFGQNTLGPLLIDMRNKNTTLFNGCFSNNEDLSSLNKALDKGTNEQMKWAIHIIRWMRGIHPSVMEKVEFKTFAALVDLSIQQGGIDKVKDIIKAKSLSSPTNTQYAFAKLVVEERGSTASARWRADCISRRLGILNKKATSYSHSGYVARRDNSKFSLIKEVYICEL